ncbi:BtrH N-terminal domain-containing protein, partial [Micromonospora sp. NPDC051296]|uniref:BtrH N-terminal domain-containing protein n=1 Tax=Micromonospora sp. NPDC051296 TaxID=3155046 RepID=UPI003424CEF8
MTSDKHLKARIRARMARTGERYAEARRHIVGTSREQTDHGYALRGGVHPEAANIANLLHHHGREISEAMVLGVGGGLGAGYILWEFAAYDTAVLTLGFRHRWNYLDWTDATLTRLGVPFRVERTGGAKKAQAALAAALDAGHPAIVVPDRQIVGYWHLPAHLDG